MIGEQLTPLWRQQAELWLGQLVRGVVLFPVLQHVRSMSSRQSYKHKEHRGATTDIEGCSVSHEHAIRASTRAYCAPQRVCSSEDTVKHIIKRDGFRGMYRGLGPTILGYLPTWAIYFAVYDGIKTRFGEAPLGTANSRGHIYPAAQVKGYQPIMREHPWSLHILSAMTAGAASTICTNPMWVIKTRFMVRMHSYSNGLILSWHVL